MLIVLKKMTCVYSTLQLNPVLPDCCSTVLCDFRFQSNPCCTNALFIAKSTKNPQLNLKLEGVSPLVAKQLLNTLLGPSISPDKVGSQWPSLCLPCSKSVMQVPRS
jgi:hypothetical protein